ncbi:nucleotidyl transferase AbiEii/AbiGii toxin family protein [Sulfurihydrogenibium subterraneum]|uniref:nucleotidyl transferase AbiEii/AbiGii toxin family protein n=1 Tax=Sulfurihydrogenibium subterraneum TaxID=171121 RepID=UPI000684E7B1|nr:nucleotidyl transferase AbiEii/AbiGii toxin family protein [Sulfurihydrogenibium subterraneum]
MKEIDWKELLNLAVDILEEANINTDDWAFGGGTALMFYFHHRKSRDVDIFLKNPQLLTRLSPRLNEKAEEISKEYIEQANFIKLKLNSQEIDFIVAPNLTGLKPKKVKIDSKEIYIEQPEEIIAKKLFYRPESLKIRDIIDTVEVFKNSPNLMNILKKNKLLNEEVIKKRFEYLKKKEKDLNISDLLLEKPINIQEVFDIFENLLNKDNYQKLSI